MNGNVMRTPSPMAAPYWGILQGLSKPLKLELVVLLSESMERSDEENAHIFHSSALSEEERKAGLMSLAGCWASDPEDAVRMEAAVKECREHDVLREVNLDD